MRERLKGGDAMRKNDRITPAYAGKTRLSEDEKNGTKDHPRVCGKDNAHRSAFQRRAGSPPRMRERPKAMDGILKGVGITPAYAGKTRFASAR